MPFKATPVRVRCYSPFKIRTSMEWKLFTNKTIPLSVWTAFSINYQGDLVIKVIPVDLMYMNNVQQI